jgi:hypothetical protein
MLRRIILITTASFLLLTTPIPVRQLSASPASNRTRAVAPASPVDITSLRAWLTSTYGTSLNNGPAYLGSELCLMCHNGRVAVNMASWRTTQHASTYIRPMAQWALVPGKGVLANSTGGKSDDFLAGLDFNKISSAFDAYKPNAPKLGVQNGTYTITIGPLTMPVIFTLQWRGPTGAWEQLFCVRVPVTDSQSGKTGAVYSSPLFYTTDAGWEAYAPEAWYNDQGQPRFGTTTVTADVMSVGESHDQNCVGCHATGVRSMAQNAQGEWVFSGFSAVAYSPDNPSYFDYTGDGTAEVMNVGCESCHGPGLAHVLGNGNKAAIVNPANLDAHAANEVCGQCHSVIASADGNFGWAYDAKTNQGWYPGSKIPLQSYVQDAGAYWPDNKTGMDTSQYPELNESVKTTNSFHPVRCTECHDAMTATSNNAQIVDSISAGGVSIATNTANNTLCLSCHATHGSFANITTGQVADYANQSDAIGKVVSQHTHHPYAPERIMGLSRCTQCHMAMTQGPDAALALHGHTFEAIPPQKTLKYQDAGGMPSSCALSCHASRVDVFDMGVTSDLHTWNKPFDVTLAQELEKYLGPNGQWWKVDVNAGGVPARTSSFPAVRTSNVKSHHRSPQRMIKR